MPPATVPGVSEVLFLIELDGIADQVPSLLVYARSLTADRDDSFLSDLSAYSLANLAAVDPCGSAAIEFVSTRIPQLRLYQSGGNWSREGRGKVS